jgi:hypothetical protein
LALPLVSDNPEVTQTTEQKASNEEPSDASFIQLLDIYNMIDSAQEEPEVVENNDIFCEHNEEVSKLQDMRTDFSIGLIGLEADHPFEENLGHLSNTNHIHVDIEQHLYF